MKYPRAEDLNRIEKEEKAQISLHVPWSKPGRLFSLFPLSEAHLQRRQGLSPVFRDQDEESMIYEKEDASTKIDTRPLCVFVFT